MRPTETIKGSKIPPAKGAEAPILPDQECILPSEEAAEERLVLQLVLQLLHSW